MKSFKLSYSSLNLREQMPQPRRLLLHLQSSVIKQHQATEYFRRCTPGSAETQALHRDSSGRAHQEIGFSDQFFTDRSLKSTSLQIVLLNFAPFLQLTVGIAFIYALQHPRNSHVEPPFTI